MGRRSTVSAVSVVPTVASARWSSTPAAFTSTTSSSDPRRSVTLTAYARATSTATFDTRAVLKPDNETVTSYLPGSTPPNV